MITLTDIQTAAASRLQDAGYTVTANEAAEGFSKPTFFIGVLPVSTTPINRFYEQITVGVELKYVPETETREHCISMWEQIKQMFLYQSLPVGDRFLSIGEMTFDIDSFNLLTYFELEFLQETNIETGQYPKMEHLNQEVKVSYGAAADINPI